MAVSGGFRLFTNVIKSTCHSTVVRRLNTRAWSTATASAIKQDQKLTINSAMPMTSQSTKIIFSDNRSCDFKYIWLRDNCVCTQCIHPETRQKLLDSPLISASIKPKSLEVNSDGDLTIDWPENKLGSDDHRSVYGAAWLHKHGLCFAQDTFDLSEETVHFKEPSVMWDRTAIWKNFPEISYREVMEKDEGLALYLQMIARYGFAIIRDVPTEKDEIIKVVKRFAYVKETSYGITFDVLCAPDPNAHLAYTGRRLELHTDLNYREKVPGLQLLHCLRSESLGDTGGKSFFVDGFFVAKWLQTHQPAAFHILSSTPLKFSIKNKNLKYSQYWPIICTDKQDEITEIHYNNRTMGPVQTPSHLVLPFYHAYRLFSEKLRDPSCELVFNLVPGDLVAFNNRRVLHGRTAFDARQVKRHLQGCYVDIDEAMSTFGHLMSGDQPEQ
uniref:Gamma-butyrobetaine dioxygenase n=1 Tax=Strigamia maritima TaxID=126957 RepID=T1IZY7_STRMM